MINNIVKNGKGKEKKLMIDIIWILLSAGFMFITGFLIESFCALAARISFGIAASITLFIFFVLIFGEES